MSLSKSKCWHSNNCLHFLKRAVPLPYYLLIQRQCLTEHFMPSSRKSWKWYLTPWTVGGSPSIKLNAVWNWNNQVLEESQRKTLVLQKSSNPMQKRGPILFSKNISKSSHCHPLHLNIYYFRFFSPMRLCHPPDGSTSLKYKLPCFITTKKICKEKNALAFNWDRCCHLVLCLRLIPFHCVHICIKNRTSTALISFKVQGAYSQHSIFFVTYESAQ